MNNATLLDNLEDLAFISDAYDTAYSYLAELFYGDTTYMHIPDEYDCDAAAEQLVAELLGLA